MPWKNPRCPKCRGRTKQGKIVDEKRCFYVCRYCGNEQIGWRHVTDPERDMRLRRALKIARSEKRRRLKNGS